MGAAMPQAGERPFAPPRPSSLPPAPAPAAAARRTGAPWETPSETTTRLRPIPGEPPVPPAPTATPTPSAPPPGASPSSPATPPSGTPRYTGEAWDDLASGAHGVRACRVVV
ncbi:hypothetical protein ACTWQR_54635, partial [Streptomyces sp. 2A115]